MVLSLIKEIFQRLFSKFKYLKTLFASKEKSELPEEPAFQKSRLEIIFF